MHTLAELLTALVILIHLGIVVLEMFLWRRPAGLRTFRMDAAHAAATAVMAANQGLYNGFLAAGLIWGMLLGDGPQALSVKTFFLGCVVAAGVFGAMTVSRRIFFVQALPAILALLCANLRDTP